MLSFLGHARVFLAAGATDLRKSFDTLAGVVRNSLHLDPLSGHLFVFANARRNRPTSRAAAPAPRRGEGGERLFPLPRSAFRVPHCLSSCSQMRSTRQPARRNARFTRRSRAMFAANFRRQNAALPFGLVPCCGQPCQKQPSTNTASRCLWKTKSGRTDRENFQRPTLNFERSALGVGR